MSKHTPGPWKYYDNCNIDGTYRICALESETPEIDIGKFRIREDAELASLAPEMFELLCEIVRETDNAVWFSKITKIVAKRRGGKE